MKLTLNEIKLIINLHVENPSQSYHGTNAYANDYQIDVIAERDQIFFCLSPKNVCKWKFSKFKKNEILIKMRIIRRNNDRSIILSVLF